MNPRPPFSFDRRTVLAALAAVGTFGLLRLREPKPGEIEPGFGRDLGARVVSLLGLSEGRKPARDRNPDVLLARLFGVSAAGLQTIAAMDDPTLRRTLQQLLQQDFAAHRLVSHRGWWVAPTESLAMCIAEHLYENQPATTCYAVLAWQQRQQQSHG